jgi:hypothetical protein
VAVGVKAAHIYVVPVLLLLQVLNMAVNSWLKSVLGEWSG